MKKNLMALIFLCSTLSQQVWAVNQTHESIDGIETTVNEMVITHSELQNAIETVKKQSASNSISLPSDADLHKQVLDQLINRKLQLQLAEQANVSASDKEVNDAIKQVAQQNNISSDEVFQKVELQGMSKTDYLKEIREQIILQKIQGQEVASRITVTPQEVDDFIRSKTWQASNSKEYHLEDILIGIPDEPTSEQITNAKSQANNILRQIHQGMNFQKAAMAESNSATALQGGDLGWRKLPEIPTIFANQVIQMKSDDIVGPIQAQNGFHIIHLAGVRGNNSSINDANQRKQVTQLVFQRKLEEGLQNWIKKLRSSASINSAPSLLAGNNKNEGEKIEA